ncbi:MAG: caspase family protein [Wenzhouxiangella sp.]|jgi:uncharacterized caspase-like protein|nr:caspase family protein [Wenzhouxiangella sp.]
MYQPLCTGKLAAVAVLLFAVQGCFAQQVREFSEDAVETEGFSEYDDLYVVDCLLPGEVRRMGRSMFMSPRRPVRTTAIDCRIRGGEYTAYSRANYQSALGVWLERAREGDAEAQHYVGEIYEKGLGRAPDYAEAMAWYLRAAEQGYSRSQVNLGYFYERGLGVEPNPTEALKWYRRAAGVDDDDLIFASAAQQRMESLRAELEEELEQSQAEKRALSQQVQALREQLDRQAGTNAEAEATIATLEGMLARVEDRAAETEGRLVRLRGSEIAAPPAASAEQATAQRQHFSGNVDTERFGKYFALIVGLQSYAYWEPLESPHQDARRLAEILSSRYGFDTTLLLDASGKEILSSINDLRERVGPEDNVLLYFAGHGQLLRPEAEQLRRGYWLPVNAELDRTTFWVSNSAINDYLAILDARSVLVVADSCFGGAMSTDPATMMLGAGMELSDRLIDLSLSRRARFVISSGGLRPVLDGSSGEHSVFARALIESLEGASSLLRAQDVFAQVAERTASLAAVQGMDQRPEMRPIREAGHEAGSFFFIPMGDGGSG